MFTTMRRVVLTGVLAVLASAQAWAVIPISTCPFTISVPGNYIVTADLLTCAGDGIDINASNVTVNLNGHMITGTPGAGTGINVTSGGSPRLNHIGISGPGLIQGFNYGITISNSDYVQVSLTTVSNVARAGAGGISAENVTYLTVAGNVIGGTPKAEFIGLLVGQSTGAQVTGNQIVGNGVGVWLLSGDSNSLTGNVVNGNSGSGIILGNVVSPVPLTNSRVSSNTTNLNGVIGLSAGPYNTVSSVGNEIYNNTSVGNTIDLDDGNTSGCGTDFWSSNVHFTTNQACVK